jgi:hypothetical protein
VNADAIAQLRTWPVYLINLKGRPDRLADTLDQLERCRWTELFQPPTILRAWHGWKLPIPDGGMSGAWGCKRSHEDALRRSIEDSSEGAVILEDDFEVQPDRPFVDEMMRFLIDVPDEWDQLMPGYQAWGSDPQIVTPNVVRLRSSNRTQFYIIRDRPPVEFRRELLRLFLSQAGGHCDHLMGAVQASYNVFAPTVQVCGQRASFSNITGTTESSRHWIWPIPGRPVLVLHAPRDVVDELKRRQLVTLHEPTEWQPARVADELKQLQVEAMTAGTVVVILHADATALSLVPYTVDPVFAVCGSSVDEVMERLPARVREVMRHG